MRAYQRSLLLVMLAGCSGATTTKPAARKSTPDATRKKEPVNDSTHATLVVVVQTKAGKPVKGVGVRILSGEATPARAVSDERGELTFTADEGPLQVIVDDPAHPPTTGYADLKVGARERVVLELLDGTVVTGTVVDPAGKPIADAEIEILSYGLILPPRTKTDANGHFTSVLAEGEWEMKASKPGKSDTWTTLAIPAGQATATVTIEVPNSAALLVETNCKSKGCVTASVDVSVENSGFVQYLDASGASTFGELPVGDAVVTVLDDTDQRHPAYGQTKIKLVPGNQKVKVKVKRLDASASVSGVLVEDGKQATTADGGQLVVDVYFRGFGRRVVAAADGSFTVPNLVPGECQLTGLRIDPTDPMSGANGGRSVTPVVAPAKGVKVSVNHFFP